MTLRHAYLKARSLTRSVFGALPDFLIIGAQKGGTTSLYRNLLQHPWVVPALRKEIHFFDREYSRGLRWYNGQFQVAYKKKIYSRIVEGRSMLTGEATPSYLYHPHAPARVFETLPHAKIIIMLRNPVDRAFSNHQYHVKLKAESLPFEDAIAREAYRLASNFDPAGDDYESDSFYNYSYLARGRYIEQVQRWLSVFPREQVLIIKSEDFFQNEAAVFRETLMFLGLPDMEVGNLDPHNVGGSSRMRSETRKRLSEYFLPYNERLYAYLNRDFGWS